MSPAKKVGHIAVPLKIHYIKLYECLQKFITPFQLLYVYGTTTFSTTPIHVVLQTFSKFITTPNLLIKKKKKKKLKIHYFYIYVLYTL